jgi:hypothetical protein
MVSLVLNIVMFPVLSGARGGVMVKALHYKPAGRGVRFPMVSLEFSVT